MHPKQQLDSLTAPQKTNSALLYSYPAFTVTVTAALINTLTISHHAAMRAPLKFQPF
jgi:hypothetical protein